MGNFSITGKPSMPKINVSVLDESNTKIEDNKEEKKSKTIDFENYEINGKKYNIIHIVSFVEDGLYEDAEIELIRESDISVDEADKIIDDILASIGLSKSTQADEDKKIEEITYTDKEIFDFTAKKGEYDFKKKHGVINADEKAELEKINKILARNKNASKGNDDTNVNKQEETGKCILCGKVKSPEHSIKLENCIICKECAIKAGANPSELESRNFANLTYSQFRQHIADEGSKVPEAIDHALITRFNANYSVGSLAYFNDKDEKIYLAHKVKFSYSVEDYMAYDYNQIVDFELVEDGESIAKGGLGRAVVGGLLFGGVGAVVGGVTGNRKNKAICNLLQVRITIKGSVSPEHVITIINSPTKKEGGPDGFVYRSSFESAKAILAKLQIITSERETNKISETASISAADEIRKFKGLLDDGIITEEEFNLKKKQLLGL